MRSIVSQPLGSLHFPSHAKLRLDGKEYEKNVRWDSRLTVTVRIDSTSLPLEATSILCTPFCTPFYVISRTQQDTPPRNTKKAASFSSIGAFS
jgi:hypothetical protein